MRVVAFLLADTVVVLWDFLIICSDVGEVKSTPRKDKDIASNWSAFLRDEAFAYDENVSHSWMWHCLCEHCDFPKSQSIVCVKSARRGSPFLVSSGTSRDRGGFSCRLQSCTFRAALVSFWEAVDHKYYKCIAGMSAYTGM